MIFKNARTVFYRKGKAYRIKNYIHLFEDFFKAFKKNKLEIVGIKEIKDTKKAIDIYVEFCKKHGIKVSREEEYREWVGKPGALIIKLKKV